MKRKSNNSIGEERKEDIDVGDLIIQNSLLKGSNNNNNNYYYILL